MLNENYSLLRSGTASGPNHTVHPVRNGFPRRAPRKDDREACGSWRPREKCAQTLHCRCEPISLSLDAVTQASTLESLRVSHGASYASHKLVLTAR